MAEKKKLWIVSEMFYPDETSTAYIMTNIAGFLADQYSVNIICGPVGYNSILSNTTASDLDVKVHRINAFNISKNNLLLRLLRILMLSLGIFFKGLFAIKKGDKVLVVTNPAFIIPLYAIISRIKKCKYHVLVHDVFPENMIPAGIIKSESNLVYRVLRVFYNWSYKQANSLIVLGRDMYDVMRFKTSEQINITIIENWADLDTITLTDFASNPIIAAHNLQHKIVFTFAGNIGRVQGLEYLFDVIKEITNSKIHFVFVGDGALLKQLKKRVEKEGFTNVTFLGVLPRQQQNVFLNASHFGLVTLASELYGLGVPSKTYNIMAAGKPIVFIGNKKAEVARVIQEHNCGYVFDDDDRAGLVNFFNAFSDDGLKEASAMGGVSRTLAETVYSKNHISNKFKALFVND